MKDEISTLLDTLTEKTCSYMIEIDPHKLDYQTIPYYIAEEANHRGSYVRDSDREILEKYENLFEITVWPRTPVTHFTLFTDNLLDGLKKAVKELDNA